MCEKSGDTLVQGAVESFHNTQLLGSIANQVFAMNSGVHQVLIHLSQCVLASLIVMQLLAPLTLAAAALARTGELAQLTMAPDSDRGPQDFYMTQELEAHVLNDSSTPVRLTAIYPWRRASAQFERRR